jgi:hypothetical protein
MQSLNRWLGNNSLERAFLFFFIFIAGTIKLKWVVINDIEFILALKSFRITLTIGSLTYHIDLTIIVINKLLNSGLFLITWRPCMELKSTATASFLLGLITLPLYHRG